MSMSFEQMKSLSPEEQHNLFKRLNAIRKVGKSVNYGSVYNASPATIARTGGITLEDAVAAHKGYWIKNAGVKAIAEEQVVIQTKDKLRWLVNPINGFCYSLRKDSDRFSTLIQGTGAFMFDMWLDEMLKIMDERFGRKTLSACFHDEFVVIVKDNINAKEFMIETLTQAIENVNDKFMLRRRLGADYAFGKNYSDVH